MKDTFVVRPKYIFKHPFSKYDLSGHKGSSQSLTDYFNYGFNEDTFCCYERLAKRFIEAIDHRKNLHFFDHPSELMRLNDEVPMDFGGFCKFHDPALVDKDTPSDFHSGQPLMRYFIMMIFAGGNKIEHPLQELIRSMYEGEEEQGNSDGALFEIVEQIGKNLEEKYRETMAKLNKLAQKVKVNNEPNKEKVAKLQNNKLKLDEIDKTEDKKKDKDKHDQKDKTKTDKIKKHQSSSESDFDDSFSTQAKRKKIQKKKRSQHSHDRHKSHKIKKQSRQSRQRHKFKKVKKEKHKKRSKSHHKRKH